MFVMPLFSSSSRTAARTFCAPAATPHVPMWTKILPLKAPSWRRCAVRAASLFSRSFSIVSLGMLRRLSVFLHDARQVLARQFPVELSPHHDRRGKPAAPDASNGLESELHVGCRLLRLDGEQVADFLHQPLASSHIAGRPHTDVDDMAPSGHDAEGAVEGRDSVKVRQRVSRFLGDVFQYAFGEVVEGRVDFLKNGHERPVVGPVPRHNICDLLPVREIDLDPWTLEGLHPVLYGTTRHASPAAGAFRLVHKAWPPLDGDREITRLPLDAFHFAQGEDFNVPVPADLDQPRGHGAHGAIVGGESLVELGHDPADAGLALGQVNLDAGGREIEGRLHAADSAADYQGGADRMGLGCLRRHREQPPGRALAAWLSP